MMPKKTITINELMTVIMDNGPITLNEICEILDYPKSEYGRSIYPKIGRLCRQGYVKKNMLADKAGHSEMQYYC